MLEVISCELVELLSLNPKLDKLVGDDSLVGDDADNVLDELEEV